MKRNRWNRTPIGPVLKTGTAAVGIAGLVACGGWEGKSANDTGDTSSNDRASTTGTSSGYYWTDTASWTGTTTGPWTDTSEGSGADTAPTDTGDHTTQDTGDTGTLWTGTMAGDLKPFDPVEGTHTERLAPSALGAMPTPDGS